MFERFTERARLVVPRARARALVAGRGVIETADLVLSMLDDEKSHAVTTLVALGLDVDALRRAVAEIGPPAGDAIEREGQIPFATGARRLLEAALEAAASLGSAYIGTEHVLLALLEIEDEPVAAALATEGADAASFRAEVVQRGQRRPTGWRAGFDLGKVCANAMGIVTEAGLDRVGRAAMVAALVAEIDPATRRALESVGADPDRLAAALRREIERDASS